MTNTIANVPRQLLADLLGNDHDKRIMAERHLLAMLANAPSPAGVDVLEVIGWYTEDHLDDKSATTYSREVANRWLAKGWPVIGIANESDAQAIIDGLRGGVGAQRVKTCTALKERNDAREERDQQAQWICELVGLLLRVQVSLSLDDTEWGYGGAEKYKLLADIRAALSAGKEGE